MERATVVDAVLSRTHSWSPGPGVSAADLSAVCQALAIAAAGRGDQPGLQLSAAASRVSIDDPARAALTHFVDHLPESPAAPTERPVVQSSLDLDPAAAAATAGMEVSRTLGPFVDEFGIEHRVQILPVATTTPIVGPDGPLGYLVLHRHVGLAPHAVALPEFRHLPGPGEPGHPGLPGLPGGPPGPPQRVRLGAGGVWLSVAAATGAAATGFAGFAFTGGEADLRGVHRGPKGELVLGANATVTLTLDPVGPGPAPAPSPIGRDAQALDVAPPAQVTLVFTSTTVAVTGFEPVSAAVYGTPVTVTGAAPHASVVPAGISYLNFSGHASTNDLAPSVVQSDDVKPAHSAPIVLGGWALPITTVDASQLGNPTGGGALLLSLGAGWTVGLGTFSPPIAVVTTTVVAAPWHLVLAATNGPHRRDTRLRLWAAEPSAAPGVVPPALPRDSDLDVTIRPGALVVADTTPGREQVTVVGDVDANLDRPVAADGSRLPLDYVAAFVAYVHDSSGRLVGLLARQPSQLSGRRTLALTNALVGVGASNLLVGLLRPGAGRYHGLLAVGLPIGAILPTLPDPYAASFPTGQLVDHTMNGNLVAPLVWVGAKAPTLRFLLNGRPEVLGHQFTLLDVSTNADQFGVSVAGSRDSGSLVGVDVLSLVTPDRASAVYALPGISWEPVIDDATKDWADASTPNDGPATELRSLTVDLVPVAPRPALAHFQQAANRAPSISSFTLPFGLMAEVDSDPAGTPTSAPSFRLLKASYASGLAAGLQLAITAGATSNVGTAALPGTTTTGSSAPPPQPGGSYGDLIMGNVTPLDAAQFFNSQFSADAAGATKEVPVSRIDLSGYGTSMFSEWNIPSMDFVGVVRTHFDVLVGRTAFELVQLQTAIVPWCIRITRTIIFDRFDTGLVAKHDTGWKAVGDATFELLAASQRLPGAVSRLTNIRNIVVGTGTPLQFPSPDRTEYHAPPPSIPPIPLAQRRKCDFVPVSFDADVVFDTTRVGVRASGRVTDRAAAVQVAGWAQRNIGYGPSAGEILTVMGKLGSGGVSGTMGCTVNVGKLADDAARFTVDVSSLAVAGTSVTSTDTGGSTYPSAVALALHGTPRLPRDGAWSVSRRPSSTQVPTAVAPHTPVPLVAARQGATEQWRLLDPTDALSVASPATFYGLLQGTGTSKTLFEHTVVDNSGRAVNLDNAHPPNLADVSALLGATDVFPNLGSILRLGNALAPLHLDPDGFKQTYDHEFPLGSVPDRTIFQLGIIKIVVSYQAPKAPDSSTMLPTKVTFVLDPTGSPRWSLSITNLSFLVMVDGFGSDPLLRFYGGFAGDELHKPSVTGLQVVYGPALGVVKDVFSGLGDLISQLGLGKDELDVAFSGNHLSVRNYLALPTIPLGFGEIHDLTLDLGFDAVIPSSAQFHVGLGSKDKPFTWLVSPLSGTGSMVLGARNGDIDVYVEGGLGLGLAIDVGIASGSASITLQLAVDVSPAAIAVTGGLLGQAEVDVLGGVASASLTLEASLTITAKPLAFPPSDVSVTAEVSVGIHISICWVISIDFDGSWQFSQDVPVTL